MDIVRRHPRRVAAGGGISLAAQIANDIYRNPQAYRDFANTARAGLSHYASKIGRWYRKFSNVYRRNVRQKNQMSRINKAGGWHKGGYGMMGTKVFNSRNTKYKGKRRARKFKGRRGGSMKKMLKLLWKELHCPQTLRYHNALQVQSLGNGVRTVFYYPLNTRVDVANMASRAPASNYFSITTAGNATTQTQYGQPNKLHVRKSYYKFEIQNRSDYNMHLKVYECIARRDTAISSSNANFVSYFFGTGKAYSMEQAATNQGPGKGTFAGGNDVLTRDYQNPGWTPYMASAFCSAFKILDCKTFVIPHNEYVCAKYYINRKVFDQQYLNQIATDLNVNCYGKWSKILLFSWVGGPVDTGHFADALQSRSNPTLSLQFDYEYKFYWERVSAPMYSIASSNTASSFQGFNSTAQYNTVSTNTFYVPTDENVGTISQAPAAAGHDPNELMTEEAGL